MTDCESDNKNHDVMNVLSHDTVIFKKCPIYFKLQSDSAKIKKELHKYTKKEGHFQTFLLLLWLRLDNSLNYKSLLKQTTIIHH